MIERVPEPELAADEQEARLYHQMDHSSVNRSFVDDLFSGGPVGPQVIDLGCGPAAILVELCTRDREIRAMGLDLDIAMLEIARREVEIHAMLEQITLQQADLKTMDVFDSEMADTIVSNSVAHHLPDPAQLIRDAVRMARPGGRVFIRDLFRPESNEEIESLVRQHAGDEPDQAQQLLRQSLHAAMHIDEVWKALAEIGISEDHAQLTSDRHWTLDWTKPNEQSD